MNGEKRSTFFRLPESVCFSPRKFKAAAAASTKTVTRLGRQPASMCWHNVSMLGAGWRVDVALGKLPPCRSLFTSLGC